MYAAIVVGVIIIGMSIFFVYSSDQAKQRGMAFSKALEFVQEDLRKQTHAFDSKVSMFKRGDINKDDFVEFGDSHLLKMSVIISRYNNLQTPQAFVPAVDLFKLSAETQLQSDQNMIEWVRTGDITAQIRSDVFLQQSFEYEQAALYEFNLQQRKANP